MKFSINGRWTIIIAALLAINMYNIPFVSYIGLEDKGPTWLGLDVSWQMTTSYGLNHGWSWGKDIIYTYGPLAFLSTRIGWNIPAVIFILMDVFLVLNFFFVFKDIIARSHNKLLGILAAFGITLMIGVFHNLSWLMLFFILFWLYKISLKPSLPGYGMLYILIPVSFFVKVNAGLFGLFFFGGLLLINVLTRRQKPLVAVLLLAIPSIMIVLLGLALKVSLVAYFTSALEMIKGYNEIMYLHQDIPLQEIVLHLLFFILCFISIRYMIKSWKAKDYNTAYFSLLIFGYVFLLRKQSILRDDIQHMGEFISYAPLVLFYGGFADKEVLFKRLQALSLAAILISYVGSYAFRPFTQVLVKRYTYLPQYLKEIKNYDPQSYANLASKRKIPERILQKMGNAPADVFPWDSEYLIENHLNYRPRPIFQSYSAYTAPLAEANYLAYERHPPAFILFDYDTVDGRYPLNDDPLVSAFLARNYTVADTFTSNDRWRLLLQKKDVIRPVKLRLIKESRMNADTEVHLGKAKYLRIKLKPNLLNSFLTFIDQPQPLRIGYKTAAGEWFYARISPEMLKTGVLVEKMINDNRDFAKYLQSPDSVADVVSVKMERAPFCYQTEMTVSYFEIL